MFFGRKNKKSKVKCTMCGSKLEHKSSFCPHCGSPLIDKDKEMKEFGMLGRADSIQNPLAQSGTPNLGITDKIIGSVVNSLVKNLDKQFKEIDKNMDKAEVQSFPNGIRIKIGGVPIMQQPQKPVNRPTNRREITDDQIRKMSDLPRTTAKSNIKRLSDKVVYELATPGVASTKDVFVSKIESGYEIKAIGNKKVYINNIPISLPLKGYSITDNKLLVEFHAQDEQ